MKVSVRLLEYGLHIYMILLLSSAFIPLWQHMQTGEQNDLVDSSPLMRILLMTGYGLSLLFLLRQPRHAVKTSTHAPWLWALVGLALLSVTWSQFPELTFRRALATTLTFSYGLVLTQRFKFIDLIRLLGLTLTIVIIASLSLALFLPEWGIMIGIHAGNWRGVFLHKNTLGIVSVLGMLTMTCLIPASRGRQRWFWSIGFILSAITLLGAQSTTAFALTILIGTATTLIIFLAPLRKKNNFLLMLIIGALGLAGLWILFYTYVDLLNLLGRNASLTGRIPLWQASLEAGLQRPWTGWGFGVFWLGWQGASAEVWSAIEWQPSQGHNGYLDLFLELGLPGLLFGLLLLFKIGIGLLKGFWQDSARPKMIFMLGLWIFLLSYNLSESIFLRQNTIYLALMAWLAFQSHAGLPEEKQPTRPDSSDIRTRKASHAEQQL